MDRISRDQEHIAAFYKQAAFSGVRIVTVAEGDISELHIGLKGTMSALFLKDLALKIHRGIEGRVRQGHSGGGLSFGYRVERSIGPNGLPTTGALRIEPPEAAIVCRVFARFVAGESPRAIAKKLNAESVGGARGGQWTASLILGNATRQTGLLRNRLYIGERTWNRQQFVKDPSTGRRVARPNPREAWVISAAPELRIVDAQLWEAAQAQLIAKRSRMLDDEAADAALQVPNRGTRLAASRRPSWLLSGLVRCGLCNGIMAITSSGGRLGCANRHERGTCTNGRTILRDRLLPRVLAGLKHRLLTPELVAHFVEEYVAAVREANQTRLASRSRLAAEMSKVERQGRNLLDLIKEGHGTAGMVPELRFLELRRDDLAGQVRAAEVDDPVPTPHPNLPDEFRRKVANLEQALQDPEAAAAAAQALRSIVDAIVVHPEAARGEVSVELRGDLVAFLALSEPGGQTASRTTVLPLGVRRSAVLGTLVAGTGFEPVTFRL